MVKKPTTPSGDSFEGYRGEDGRFVSKKKGEQLPKDKVTKERIPKPGRGDTGRKKGGKQ